MAKRSGALVIGGRAIQAAARGASIIVPVTVAYAVLVTAVDKAIFDMVSPSGALPSQEDLVRVLLPLNGVIIATELLLGPIIAALAVYTGRCFTEGLAPSLYKGLNFALNRYGRMFLPHLAAQLSIQLGLVIIIPGILFMMQYAFVDAVAALEDERAPLNRSKRLTRGRRRSIFLLFLPWLILSQALLFAELWALGEGPLAMFAVKIPAFLLIFIMQIGFYLLYDERTRKRRKKSDADNKPASPPSDGALVTKNNG